MAFTFGNVALVVALVIVSILLGFRTGRRHGYAEGHADGMFAGEDYVYKYLTEEEENRVRADMLKRAREIGRMLKERCERGD